MQFDTQSGILRDESWTDQSPTWSALFCGDWAPMGPHLTSIQADPSHFYHDLLPHLVASDVSFVNVECVLGNLTQPIVKDGPPLIAPTMVINGLSVARFTVGCLANNHCMDYGRAGLESTLKTLKHIGMSTIGAGLTSEQARAAFETKIHGQNLAVLNVAEGEEGVAKNGDAGVASLDLYQIRLQIQDLKKSGFIVLMIVHAGREYVPVPPPYIHTMYRTFIDMGADAVIGHHPHVPQGIEIYNGKLIIYSLGNFAFWDPDGHPWQKLGYVVKVNFVQEKLHSAELIPYRISEDGLKRLSDVERSEFLLQLNTHSTLLHDPNDVSTIWNAFADRWSDKYLSEELMQISSLLLSETDLLRATRAGFANHPGNIGKVLRRLLLFQQQTLSRLGSPKPPQFHLQQGSAILRNRFDTEAHRQLFLTALDRMMHQKMGTTPQWAIDFLNRWYSQFPS